ncbi:MAG: hypothetical protein L0229_14945 [Blastocatellia bacterium]|nr:hypothetical protein [Blastocatellia bacterium]
MTNRAGRFRFEGVVFGAMLFLAMVATVGGQIQFGKPKKSKPLPNPSILAASRDEVLTIAKQMLEMREIPLDKEDCSPTTGECTLISKPVVFVKGIPTRSQLEHYCEVPVAAVRNWIKGRYVLRIQINPASPDKSLVGVYAKFEGMTGEAMSNGWVPLASRGELEDRLLRCIQDRLQGGDCTSDEIK